MEQIGSKKRHTEMRPFRVSAENDTSHLTLLSIISDNYEIKNCSFIGAVKNSISLYTSYRVCPNRNPSCAAFEFINPVRFNQTVQHKILDVIVMAAGT